MVDRKLKGDSSLPVMEEFYTIQGEGFHSGKAAVFIRLAGCDVGCHWCDVKESWEVSKQQYRSIDSIVDFAEKQNSNFAVITGGEPVMYQLDTLCTALIKKKFKLALETSGAYPLSGVWHWICLSPKKRKPPQKEYYKKANELKIIIYNQSDFKWAEEHASQVNKDCKLFLQVEWSKRKVMSQKIVEYVKNNPQWQISIQTHNYLDIP